jgi:subtilase family serine protease
MMCTRALAFCILSALVATVSPIMVWASTQAKPDLRVVGLTVEKIQVDNVPLRVKVTLEIKNFGATTSGGFTTRLSYRTKSTEPYTSLYDFQSGTRQVNGGDRWDRTFDFQAGGTYYFKAEVDANKQIAESAEGNNTKTLAKSFVGGTPDLTVKNVVAQFKSVTSSAARARVDWDVENAGDGKATGSFVIALKVSKNGTNFAELARFTKAGLDKGQTYHYFKEVSYSDVRSLRFMIVVDATNTIHESHEGNNSAYSETIHP